MLAGRDPQREGCGGAAELSPSTWSLLPSPRVGESSSELFWGQTAAELVKQRVKKWEGGLRSPLCVRKVKSTINSELLSYNANTARTGFCFSWKKRSGNNGNNEKRKKMLDQES